MNLSFRRSWAALLLGSALVSSANAETLADLSKHTHYHGVAFARAGSASLLLATHHGLYAVAADGTAILVSPVQDFMGFSPDPADPLSYFASGHPAEGGNSGFLKSADGGATWMQISEGAGGPVDFHQMDVSPADPNIIYGHFGRIQVSRDGGATWVAEGKPVPGLIALAASSVETNRLYAATKTGLAASEDGGKSFAPIAFEGQVVSTVETGTDGALYAFVLGKGFASAKESVPQTWTELSNSFGEAIPLHIAVDPKDGQHLALTTQNNDVLESRDGGTNWKPFGTP